MCGIAGIYHFDPLHPVDRDKLCRMTEVQAHRGPDDQGFWVEQNIGFGHQRLSIIDLSKAGHQPMIYENRLVLTYNGEIYNYLELRRELRDRGHTFQSDCDTEIILAAYSEWGDQCVQKFNGMWAFALWDRQNKTLFCSRDRIGIKPFHFMVKNKTFYFASEAKALYQLEECSGSINDAQLQRFLQLGWVIYRDKSLLEDIKNLPAAHNLIVRNGKTSLKQYWDLENFETDDRSLAEKTEQFSVLFEDAIEKHMRSDVPVGSCLSGGLDSSSIVSQIQKSFPENKLNTFSAYYSMLPGYDEREYISCFSGFEQINQHFIEPSGKDIHDHYLDYLWHQDFPTRASSSFSQYFVMRLAKEHNTKVIIDGQGGDEILAGYHHHFFRYYADLIGKFKWKALLDAMIRYKHEQQNSIFEIWQMLAKSIALTLISEETYYRFATNWSQPNLLNKDRKPPTTRIEISEKKISRLSNIMYQELLLTSLPNLLHYEDRNSMAFSVESRVPFLDYRLVEFCFNTMPEDKLTGSETKRLLREGLSDILPAPIKNRKDKMGFVTPGEVVWLRNELSDFVTNARLEASIWDVEKAQKVIQRFMQGEDQFGEITWRMIGVHYWLKHLSSVTKI